MSASATQGGHNKLAPFLWLTVHYNESVVFVCERHCLDYCNDVACADIMGAGWRQQEARGREEGQVIGVSVSAGGQQVTSPGHSTVDSSGGEMTTAETAGHRSTQRTGLLAFRESLSALHNLCLHIIRVSRWCNG